MAMPAHSMTGTMAVLDVETMLKRLPAEARAQLAWAQRPVETGILRLRREPLTDELVAEVAQQIGQPLQAITRAVWRTLASNFDEFRAVLMQDFRRDEDRLTTFVEDDESRDTARWVIGIVRSFYESPVVAVGLDVAPTFDESFWQQVAADPDVQKLNQGMVALIAAVEESKHGTDRSRAADLLDVSFLALNDFRTRARSQGVWFSPFATETVEERRTQLLHYAERLRSSLSEQDWAVLEQARMTGLR